MAPSPGAVVGLSSLEERHLAVERRIDFALDDRVARAAQSPAMPLALARSASEVDQAVVGRRLVAQLGDLAERQVERPAGREIAARRLGAAVPRFHSRGAWRIPTGATDRPRRRRAVSTGWVLFEEVGDAEIVAVLLADVIGVLDAAEAELAVSDEFCSEPVDDDLAVERGGRRQAGRVDRLQRRQRALCPCARLSRARLVVGLGVEGRAQGRQLALVDPEAGREARRIFTFLQEDLVEQALSAASPSGAARRRRGGG